jgi:hypothetical protein
MTKCSNHTLTFTSWLLILQVLIFRGYLLPTADSILIPVLSVVLRCVQILLALLYFYVTTDWLSVGQAVLVSSTRLGVTTSFLLLSDSCGFVGVGRSFWGENGSAVYYCCWFSSAQSFLGPSSAGLVTVFYSRFETPPTWRLCSFIYIPQGQGGPVIPPGIGFQSQSHCYFTTGGLPPFSLSWRQAPWDLPPTEPLRY